jgi:hypothetical protein
MSKLAFSYVASDTESPENVVEGVEASQETSTTRAQPQNVWMGFLKSKSPPPPVTSVEHDSGKGLSTFSSGEREDGQEEGLPDDLTNRLSDERGPEIVGFYALQEWDGYILNIRPDAFVARLTNLTSEEEADAAEATIPLEELDEGSIAKLKPGRLFRWSIGFEHSRSGQRTRVSRIVVRDLPAWTSAELDRAWREAEELAGLLRWE